MHEFTMERLLPEHKLIYLEDFRKEIRAMEGMDFSMLPKGYITSLQQIEKSPDAYLQTAASRPRQSSALRRFFKLFLGRKGSRLFLHLLGFELFAYEKQPGFRIFSVLGTPLLQYHVHVDLVHHPSEQH